MNESIEQIKTIITIANTILNELDYVENNTSKESRTITERINWDGSPDYSFNNHQNVASKDANFKNERFVAYLRLLVDGREEIWFYTRHVPTPLKGSNENIKYYKIIALGEMLAKPGRLKYVCESYKHNEVK